MNTPQKNINRIKILLVDDNPDNLRVLSDILLEYGYQTRKVISGEMALKAVKANDFDLIFLDINMPQLDGYEVCHYLKQDPETAHIPIIFISALSDGKDKSKAFAAGGADYIDKPFQFEEVIARVEHQIKILNLQRELKDLNTSLEDKISASTKELELANQKFKQTQKRLFQLTLKDSVTNLDNKVSFKGHLEQVIKQVKNKPNYGFTLLVFNCRCPYLSNKLFDLNLEDSLAIAIAEILTTSLPKESIIARLGDCEYAVIIKQLQDSSTANKLAAEIKQKLMLPINIKHQQLELIANYGVAVGTQKNPKLDSLFQETIILARQGNHQNSEDLENNLTEKPTESNEKSNILKLEQKIREALKRKEITIFYQPILSLTNHKIQALEISWSWDNPEVTKLIRQQPSLSAHVLAWVLKIVNRDRLKWQDSMIWNLDASCFQENIQIRLRLTEEQLSIPSIVQHLGQMTDRLEINSSNIILEIPESFIVHNCQAALKIIHKLSEHNFSLSIDHLSANYLALKSYHNLSINNLKLMGISFYSKNKLPSEKDIFSKIFNVCQELNITITMAEVANHQQLDFWKSLGCTFAMGDLISQPLTSQQIEAIIFKAKLL